MPRTILTTEIAPKKTIDCAAWNFTSGSFFPTNRKMIPVSHPNAYDRIALVLLSEPADCGLFVGC